MNRIAAVALCSGLSRRFGRQNKLLYPLDGKPLYRHTLEKLLFLPFTERVAVTVYPEIAAFCRENGFLLPENRTFEEGIASSVRAGVRAAPDVDGWMFFPCDQPRLGTAEISRILAHFSPERIVVPTCGGHPSSPCLFPARFREELLALTGDAGGKQVYRKHPEQVLYLPFAEEAPFRDWDTYQSTMEELDADHTKLRQGGESGTGV